jgi:hypothetical protein
MKVRVQLYRDDGTLICEHYADALESLKWETDPGQHLVAENHKVMYGFTYKPILSWLESTVPSNA